MLKMCGSKLGRLWAEMFLGMLYKCVPRWLETPSILINEYKLFGMGFVGVCRGLNSDFLDDQKSEKMRIFSKVRKKSLDGFTSEAICSIN